eukprot:TRINITY_DN1232_c1_g2_i1.p1 TRINITY_DN1232_c1_g2~~TRINITY_DN1232_c1_g2_i1.p1  ORF type:complete len:755 (-),score=163.94 TRINITY_DN1232_c1_g2_i1:159-2423(-)
MGCTASRLDDEDAVQFCKDRRRYIKQAVEYRIQFAAGHVAYIQSLRRVSSALRSYVEGDEHREFLSGSYAAHSFAPIKKGGPEIVAIPLKSLSSGTPIQSRTGSSRIVNYYMRSSANPYVSVEERPQSPEIVRVESYSPMHQYGMDGFLSMPPPYTASSFFSSSPYNRPSIPPPSPQTSQWDFFWNPFSSLDTYGYPTRSSVDQSIINDEVMRLRRVREEEGIPDLEEEEEEEKVEFRKALNNERGKVDLNWGNEAVDVEEDGAETDFDTETEHEAPEESQSQTVERVEVSEARNAVEIKVGNKQEVVCEKEEKEETPGFTVFVNRTPTSMAEVVKELETQFMLISDSAKEVSTLLESSRVQYSLTGNEPTAIKMLNPIALIRSASSRSTSSRFLHASSSSRDFSYDSSSNVSEESCMFNGSHQSTLDRLYAWEKKLYEEVKSGERIRIAYDKKRMQLRNQDAKGEDPAAVDKTRASVRDLHTRINVSMHTVKSVSNRIEALRDEELQPQLMELIQGLARMWRVMAECHCSQKRTIDAAKRMLAGMPPKLRNMSGGTDLFRLSRSASNLESELRNWRACFDSWIASQRSYIRALASWALRCARSDIDPQSPRRSDGPPPIFGICIQWSRFLDALRDAPVVDGLDFFAAGVGSVFGRGEEEAKRSKRFGVGFSADTEGKMALVEREEEDERVEKTAELAVRVLCAGMSVAVSSLMEFAVSSADGYEEMANKWEQNTTNSTRSNQKQEEGEERSVM